MSYYDTRQKIVFIVHKSTRRIWFDNSWITLSIFQKKKKKKGSLALLEPWKIEVIMLIRLVISAVVVVVCRGLNVVPVQKTAIRPAAAPAAPHVDAIKSGIFALSLCLLHAASPGVCGVALAIDAGSYADLYGSSASKSKEGFSFNLPPKEPAKKRQEAPPSLPDLPKIDVPDMPSFDVPKFDVPKFDAPKFDAPKFDAPKFDAPKFEAPKFEAPKFDAPKFEAPKFEAPSVPKFDTPKFEAPSISMPPVSFPAVGGSSKYVVCLCQPKTRQQA